MKRFVCIFILVISVLPALSQKLVWDIDFLGFFDNREYDTDLTSAKTLFGVRLSPEIGVEFANSHRLMAGASWVQPFGAEVDESKLYPTLYYRYAKKGFSMSFGMFPRTQLIDKLPSYMLYDSIAIFRPNITGVLFQYQASKGYIETYIDWTQMQSSTRREAFIILAAGRWTPNIFIAGGHFSMNHLARTSEPVDGESVMDHISISPYVGVDLTSLTPKLDTLALRVGYYAGIERHRGTGEKHTPNGPLVEFNMAWKYIGMSNTFYYGDDMFPFYGLCGSQLYQGDPFHRANEWYNQTDIDFFFYRNSFVNCSAKLTFHILPNSFNFQQQLAVRFNLNEMVWKDKANRKSKPYLKGIY
ncbi:MAG: hypothetical protein IJ341_08175 [Bacteroidales bacterium]|nr:hypothetical protein [Bacteroidales bacterium]MBQ7819658.1 hypothetical protein [Bacteroidales bacterium]